MGRVFLSAVRLQRTNVVTTNIPDGRLFGNRLFWCFRGSNGLSMRPFGSPDGVHDKDVFVGAD
jgi:hypothetical protein